MYPAPNKPKHKVVCCACLVAVVLLSLLWQQNPSLRLPSTLYTRSTTTTTTTLPRQEQKQHALGGDGNVVVEKGNHPPSFESMKGYARQIDKTKHYDLCAVGAGLSGTVLAERSAHLLGKTVLVLDARPHVGGNPATGVLMNLYGSHLFHTNIKRVWDYLQETTQLYPGTPLWKPWYHQKVGRINGTYVPIPPNIITVNTLFQANIQTPEEMQEWLKTVQIPCPADGCRNAEEMALSRVGQGLYEAIFETYTIKQWNKSPREMDASVTARIPVRDNFDPRYFSDKYQALPQNGYTAWFQAVLKHPKIDVVLETDFFEHLEHLEKHCQKIVYTGPIDRYFDATRADELSSLLAANDSTKQKERSTQQDQSQTSFVWPTEKLEYRSLQFEQERYYNHAGYVLPTPVLNLPGPETPYTRAVEYKQYLHRGGKHSIVVRETSSDVGEPYYPVPTERNLELYQQYKRLADALERTGRVRFVGRLANYKYCTFCNKHEICGLHIPNVTISLSSFAFFTFRIRSQYGSSH